MATGLLLTAGVGLLLALQTANSGFTVSVPTDQIRAVVRRQVESQAVESLPEVLAAAKRELPAQVETEVAKAFDGIGLRIGEININLPASTTKELQNRMQATVEKAVGQALDRVDIASLAAEMAAQSEGLVTATLGQELDGHKFWVRPWRWLSIPVTVQVD